MPDDLTFAEHNAVLLHLIVLLEDVTLSPAIRLQQALEYAYRQALSWPAGTLDAWARHAMPATPGTR